MLNVDWQEIVLVVKRIYEFLSREPLAPVHIKFSMFIRCKHWHTHRQTDRQTDRQTHRQTDRQTVRQTDSQSLHASKIWQSATRNKNEDLKVFAM